MSDNIQDIEVLKAKYARYADAVFRTSGSDVAATALADLFTDDAVLDLGPFGRYVGRSQLLNAFKTILPAATVWSTHYIVSPIISVSSDTATGDWYFLIYLVPASPAHAPAVQIYGGYKDKYEKVHGEWKIKETLSLFFTPPA
jgi:hypothetical protein